MVDPVARCSRFAFSLAACALLLAGCRHSDGDYRVIEREYVPASEVPGVDDIDLEQVSYPVLVGSVAIAAQFPDMVWPDMVSEERWRLGLPPDLQAELLYPRECLFVSPAPNGIGTVRRIIDGEVIFLRIHRSPESAAGECRSGSSDPSGQRCYRITALSESSRMCKDSISVNRFASFSVVSEPDRSRIFYADQEAIVVRNLAIQNGCPVFGNNPKRVQKIESLTRDIRAFGARDGAIYIAWIDVLNRIRSRGLMYMAYDKKKDNDAILISDGEPSSPLFGFVESGRTVRLIWNSTRFYREFLFKVENPNKLMAVTVSENGAIPSVPVVLNKPNDVSDNAYPPILFSPENGGVSLFWRSEIAAPANGNSVQVARLNREMTNLGISMSPISLLHFERRLMQQFTEYHRRLGRGSDGPLPALECTRGAVDLPEEGAPAVLVPGKGSKAIDRGNADPESGESDGG